MNEVQKHVLRSLRERVELAKKKIAFDQEDIIYQNQIIAESQDMIDKILKDTHENAPEDSQEMQSM